MEMVRTNLQLANTTHLRQHKCCEIRLALGTILCRYSSKSIASFCFVAGCAVMFVPSGVIYFGHVVVTVKRFVVKLSKLQQICSEHNRLNFQKPPAGTCHPPICILIVFVDRVCRQFDLANITLCFEIHIRRIICFNDMTKMF